MPDGRLTIGRMNTTYVVPRGHPAPEALQRRGDEALGGPLVRALVARLQRLAVEGDGSVWIIRELSVDFPFAAETTDAGILAAAWGREIVESLTRTIRTGDGVTRFPNRAAFLAQYAFDVASGRDSGCWYYEQFDSLSALPAGAKIREALVREPAHGAEALVELARNQRLELVLRALSDRSTQAIYDCLFGHDPVSDFEPRVVERLLSFADALAERSAGGSVATPKNAIRLATSMLLNGLAKDEVCSHVGGVLTLAAWLASAAEPWRIAEALIDGDARAAVAAARTSDLTTIEMFLRLAASRPDLVTCAAGTLMPSSAPAAKSDASLASEYAGLALLLEPLADTQLFCSESPEDAAVRRAVAMFCAGEEIVRDPILDLYGEEAPPPEESIEDFAQMVLRNFAARLFGFASSSVAYLRSNFLAGRGAIHLDDAGRAITVDLPPVPLEVVLRLAGFHGKQIAVPWLPDRTITFRLGGDA